jgi:CubicO group peptidase (beta-lactamase class C family)
MSLEKLAQIDALVEKEIADKKLPGAVVLIGHKGKIVYRRSFGNRSLVPAAEKMTLDTIFDAASLTKVVAATTSIMILVEQGKVRLNDTIGKFFPEIEDENARRVTVLQLLTHVSGYQPDFDLREKWTGHDGMLRALYKEKLRQPAGMRFVYSDIGFIVLGEIVVKVSGETLDNFFHNKVVLPIGMKSSGFNAIDGTGPGNIRAGASRIAPTENIKGQQSYLGGQFDGKDGDKILRGQVHDPTAYRMNGIAGHAGMFSTADDLARFCQMLLNGGTIDGKRVLSALTIARMTAPNVIAEDGSARGLGWDMNSSFSSNRGELLPLGSFGHTGFTGTSLWIDRVTQTFVVFLSNRVHPDGKGDVTPLRARVATIAASAVEDTPIEMIRLAESTYQSQIAAQIPKFKEQLASAQAAATRVPRTVTVLNGIDVLEKGGFKELNGMRVGLVTNHTGRNLAGRQTIDILKEAPNVKLTALFSPEHGIRGAMDEKVSDSTDEKTGLPIYSLYGETRRPKPEHLKDLDALVFDIQDIGSRFYTYISTLQNVMEEAAKAGKPVFVLDRPNPINGVDVEGAVADADKLTFVATHTLPVRHGMTTGEMAQMFNAEKKIGADLRVIKMENWARAMWFDETGQTWVNPSPNMRSLTEATLYTGIGLMEYTNVSVGRGTDTPFEVIGAPWMDGQ